MVSNLKRSIMGTITLPEIITHVEGEERRDVGRPKEREPAQLN
jgi:hypothetical protein